MTKLRTSETAARPKRRRAEEVNALAVYMRDVESLERLTREQEMALVREMIRNREEIAELLRAVLLKACDTLAIATSDARSAGRVSAATTVKKASKRPLETYVAELNALRATDGAGSESGGSDLRTAIAHLEDQARLKALEAKIIAVAALARCTNGARRPAPASSKRASTGALAIEEFTANFGLPFEEIERTAASIAQKRRSIEGAKQRLVESNLRLVVYFARRVNWRGADVTDLIQEGNIALMNAVDSFDPDRGLAFGTFATIGVRRAIQRVGSVAGQVVHVPEEVRVRRRRVRKTMDYLTSREGRIPSCEQVAEYLEVPKSEVLDAVEEVAESLSLESRGDVDVVTSELRDRGPDVVELLATAEEERMACARIAQLDERKRRIIEARFGVVGNDPSSLAEIGRELMVTRERVRQIESGALRELRTREAAPRSRRRKPRPRARLRSAF